jgi:hypothetical protein
MPTDKGFVLLAIVSIFIDATDPPAVAAKLAYLD